MHVRGDSSFVNAERHTDGKAVSVKVLEEGGQPRGAERT